MKMFKVMDCINVCIYIELLNLGLFVSSNIISNRSKEHISSSIRIDSENCENEECMNFLNPYKVHARRKRHSDNSCITPESSPYKIIKFSRCNKKNSTSCDINGRVPEFTVAQITCGTGYSLAQEDIGKKSICLEEEWTPKIVRCYKICDKLDPVDVDLHCFRKGIPTACDEKSLIVGTTVRPTCKPLYTHKIFHKLRYSHPDYDDIICKHDGKWSNALLSCIHDCGRRPFDRTKFEGIPLISNGKKEHYGNSPWHVAIYNQDKILICGGTIITSQLVLSAAHCFHNEETNTKSKAENYEVVVSKFTRTYSVIDNESQKVFKIKEIRFCQKDYIGLRNHYAGDIVLLILNEPITISPTVLPACVHWANKKRDPVSGSKGKVVGWGMNDNETYAEDLMTVDLPYISHSECLKTVPDDFKPFVTFDKFCAGSETGPGVLQGDSGGGLMFLEKDGKHYIRGIVSVKQRSVTAIASFTDIADHIDWIMAVREEVEQECGHISSDGNFPWHVNIYRVGEKYPVCGGTIISPRMILTNTDCNLINPDQYEIVFKKNQSNQKIYQIREFRFFNSTDRIMIRNNDMMIIILNNAIVFNLEVSPACVNWANPNSALVSNGTAKFVQWQDTDDINVQSHVSLRTASYLNHDACINKHGNHTPGFKESITKRTNAFCLNAGYKELSKRTRQQGHGVMFEEDSRYFIRGVIGNTLYTAQNRRNNKNNRGRDAEVELASVIDILQYINWIRDVRNEVDLEYDN